MLVTKLLGQRLQYFVLRLEFTFSGQLLAMIRGKQRAPCDGQLACKPRRIDNVIDGELLRAKAEHNAVIRNRKLPCSVRRVHGETRT